MPLIASASKPDAMYPHFQPINLDAMTTLREFIQAFPPYSDFNVWNMVGWANQDRTAFCFYNDNLVLRYKDWYDHGDIYTLIGANRIDETLQELCEMANELAAVPEIVVRNITDAKGFIVEEDRDNHDYILSTEKLISLRGNDLYSIRAEVSRFPNRYPNHEVRLLDFGNPQDRQDVIEAARSWCAKKGFEEVETQGEIEGIDSFMRYGPLFNCVSLGLYHAKRMIGFTVNEVLNQAMGITHFATGDVDYEGSARYLVHITARVLHQLGCIYLNYEQDMGILGLRRAKLAYRPIDFLRKYKIRVNGATCAQGSRSNLKYNLASRFA